MNHNMNFKRAWVALTVPVAVCVANGQTFPGKSWSHGEPLSPAIERRARDFAGTLDTTAFMVVRHGRVALEYGDTRYVSYLASSRKSVLSMVYGKYAENGTIDLNRSLADLGMDDI